MNKNLFLARLSGAATFVAVVVALFFNYSIIWNDLRLDAKTYFFIIAGGATAFFLAATVYFFRRYLRSKRIIVESKPEPEQSSFLGKAVKWDNDEHYPDVQIP